MSKKVLLVHDPENGRTRVFRTLEEASEETGFAPGSFSRALRMVEKIGGFQIRWAERVYAVREKKSGGWMIAMENPRGGTYVEVGSPWRRMKRKEIDWVKDITEVWYYRGMGD